MQFVGMSIFRSTCQQKVIIFAHNIGVILFRDTLVLGCSEKKSRLVTSEYLFNSCDTYKTHTKIRKSKLKVNAHTNTHSDKRTHGT